MQPNLFVEQISRFFCGEFTESGINLLERGFEPIPNLGLVLDPIQLLEQCLSFCCGFGDDGDWGGRLCLPRFIEHHPGFRNLRRRFADSDSCCITKFNNQLLAPSA